MVVGDYLAGKLVDTHDLSSSMVRLLPQSWVRQRKWWVCLLLMLSVAAVFGLHPLQADTVEEAVLHYRQALTQAPSDVVARYQLGITLALQEKWDEAIADYSEAARQAPDNAEVRYNLGYALRASGQLDEAIVELGEAVRLKAEFAMAQYNLGCALAERGRREEAVAHLRAALRAKADYREARQELERLGRRKELRMETSKGTADWRQSHNAAGSGGRGADGGHRDRLLARDAGRVCQL